MPADGYTRMFERMLDHPNIDLLLGVDFKEAREAYPHAHLVFTGPIDEYFGYCYGKLPYRSFEFRHETLNTTQLQPVAVINYPSESVPYTRITEYKHLTGQDCARTSITYEYPSAEGDPYYPIPLPENQALFKRYEALALAQADASFVGRLATYRYYNMDQVVGQALATYRRLVARWDGQHAGLADRRRRQLRRRLCCRCPSCRRYPHRRTAPIGSGSARLFRERAITLRRRAWQPSDRWFGLGTGGRAARLRRSASAADRRAIARR